MFMLLFLSIGLPVLFLAAVFFVAKKYGSSGVFLLCLVCTGLFLFLPAPVLIVQVFFTGLISGGCIPAKARPRTVFGMAVGVFVILYGFSFFMVASRLHEMAELEEEYPIVSLAGRLEYETAKPRSQETIEQAPLSKSVETQLAWAEDEREFGTRRSLFLRQLHRDSALEFTLAQGFGVARIGQVRRQWVELPRVAPIPLLQPSQEYRPAVESSPPPADLTATNVSPAENDLQGLHFQGQRDFLDQELLGYVENREHTVGFIPHQFRDMPAISDSQTWQVTRLELVSLLRHEEPLIYVSENLPNMEALQEVPTRGLSAFEAAALPRLKTEEDLVIEQRANRIQMLGSLRASKDCLTCHSVQRGELLGAFSYELIREEPILEEEIPQPH